MKTKLFWVVCLAFIIGVMIAVGITLMITKMSFFEPLALGLVLTSGVLSIFGDKLYKQVSNSLPAQ